MPLGNVTADNITPLASSAMKYTIFFFTCAIKQINSHDTTLGHLVTMISQISSFLHILLYPYALASPTLSLSLTLPPFHPAFASTSSLTCGSSPSFPHPPPPGV